MLLTEIVEVRWAGRNRFWYEGMGYDFTAYGDYLTVSIADLLPTSNALVTYKCDFCGMEKDIPYARYLKNKELSSKDACKNCIGEKVADAKAESFRRYVESIYDHSTASEKVIPLSNGDRAWVSNEDYDMLINLCRWSLGAGGYAVGGVKQEDGSFKSVKMHRVIMNCPDGLEVDHADNNKLNNTRDNLRICTRQDNARNIPAYNMEGKHSRFKGITKNQGKWEARIKHNGRSFALGLYSDENAAANAYNHFARFLHGEYASLNEVEFMEEWEWRRCSNSRNPLTLDKLRRKLNG